MILDRRREEKAAAARSYMREAAIQVFKLEIPLIQCLEDGVLNIISLSFEMVVVMYISMTREDSRRKKLIYQRSLWGRREEEKKEKRKREEKKRRDENGIMCRCVCVCE